MGELWNALSDPGSISLAQWLLLAIFVFVVIAMGYFTLRLYKLLRNSMKAPSVGASKYQTGWTGVNKAPSRQVRGLSPQEVAQQAAANQESAKEQGREGDDADSGDKQPESGTKPE